MKTSAPPICKMGDGRSLLNRTSALQMRERNKGRSLTRRVTKQPSSAFDLLSIHGPARLHWQVRRFPGGDAAGDLAHVFEAAALEQARADRGSVSAGAIDQERLFFR